MSRVMDKILRREKPTLTLVVPTLDPRQAWAELDETQKLGMRNIVRTYKLALESGDYGTEVNAVETLYRDTCNVLAIDPQGRASFDQFPHSKYSLWRTRATLEPHKASAEDRRDAARLDAVIAGAMEQKHSAGRGLA